MGHWDTQLCHASSSPSWWPSRSPKGPCSWCHPQSQVLGDPCSEEQRDGRIASLLSAPPHPGSSASWNSNLIPGWAELVLSQPGSSSRAVLTSDGSVGGADRFWGRSWGQVLFLDVWETSTLPSPPSSSSFPAAFHFIAHLSSFRGCLLGDVSLPSSSCSSLALPLPCFCSFAVRSSLSMIVHVY